MATAQKPTKPLFTARFTLINTTYYTQKQVMDAFKPALEKAGCKVYQSPSIKGYMAKYNITEEGPFPDDDTRGVFVTMVISGPDGKDTSQAYDKVNDPKGTRPIIEQKKPAVTAIAWNICPAAGMTEQALSDLIWATRKATLYDKDHYTGVGWTPIVLSWEKTPVKKAPYPDRPAIPAALLPPPPAPPKPPPKPPAPPKPPPKPLEKKRSPWPWVALGAVGLYAYFSSDS